MAYFTDSGPDRGPFLFHDVPGIVNVLQARDEPAPIGTARCVGQDAAGVALWHLSIGGDVLAGRWVVIDREFVPAQ